MSMDYQPPEPPARQVPPSGLRSILTISTLGGLLGLGVFLALSNQRHVDAPPRTAPASTPQRLRGVVVYKSRFGFPVCSRVALHRCMADFGTIATGNGVSVIRMGPFDIAPVESCEGIGAAAVLACADAGVGPMAQSPTTALPWVACAAAHGLIARDGAVFLDPRDALESVRAGDLEIRCEEGYITGRFDDAL